MTRTPDTDETKDETIDVTVEETALPEDGDVEVVEVYENGPEDGSDGGAGRPAVPSPEIAEAIARAADERKATDIVTLDLRGISDVTDFFVIATAANNRQADAVVDRVNEVAKGELGARPLSVEGRAGLRWVLMDFGPVVFHVFQREVRDYYRLERLWGDAPRVLFGLEGEAPYEPPLPDDSVRELEETEEDLD